MKIVFAIPAMGFGGAERVVSLLANEFAKKGNEVFILSLTGNTESAYPLEDGVKLIPIKDQRSTLCTWSEFRKVCKVLHVDIVLAFMTGVGVAASTFLIGSQIPVIISERCDPSAKDMSLSLKLKVMERVSRYFTAGYVFQSEGAKAFFPKSIQKKSCIILNPLNSESLPERDPDHIDNRIVSVGRLHPQKNFKMLIDAFAASKAKEQHTLHIYGEGALRKGLEQQIQSLGLCNKIFLEGNSPKVHEEIKQAKLFAFTSDYEGLPNALMEAMAIGLPCISTDCSPGGARMLIQNGENGILVPCGDTEQFTQALNQLCNDSVKLKNYGEKARQIKERTNVETIAELWLSFVAQVKKRQCFPQIHSRCFGTKTER